MNTAARMEAHGIPGEIQVTPETRALLKPNCQLEERGWIDIKGKRVDSGLLAKREAVRVAPFQNPRWPIT